MSGAVAATPPPPALPAAALRVRAALADAGVHVDVVTLSASARTAQMAAEALGVGVGQIAKSLVFRASGSGRAVLVVAAGDRRVDEARIAAMLGEPIERATPEFVREHAGFAIGGVAPVAHARPMARFADASLRRFDVVWAAAGTPHCVFPVPAARLLDLLLRDGGVETEVA